MIHPLPPCPSKEDVVRRYEVVAVQKKLIYNRYGDHDPDGLAGNMEPVSYSPLGICATTVTMDCLGR